MVLLRSTAVFHHPKARIVPQFTLLLIALTRLICVDHRWFPCLVSAAKLFLIGGWNGTFADVVVETVIQ